MTKTRNKLVTGILFFAFVFLLLAIFTFITNINSDYPFSRFLTSLHIPFLVGLFLAVPLIISMFGKTLKLKLLYSAIPSIIISLIVVLGWFFTCTGESCMLTMPLGLFLLLGIFVNLLISFVFTLFKKKKKLIFKISITLIVLEFIILLILIIPYLINTCGFGDNVSCYSSIADKKGDPSACNQISEDKEHLCYQEYARSRSNPDICEQVSLESGKKQCYSVVCQYFRQNAKIVEYEPAVLAKCVTKGY